MDSSAILLQGAVVIVAILLGVRTGGIGLGLWGLVGLSVLVFGFGLPPGEPPTTSMFIILAVITAASTMQSVGGIDYLVEVAKKLLKRRFFFSITAASTMQAVGGIDYLVEVAKKLLKKRPAYIAVIAPIVAFIFTLGAGTGFIYYPLIPVIFAVAFANNVRPERPLAVASTASQFAITASPVSAAMATMVGILDPVGFGITDILIVVLPASIVGLLVASFLQMRVGKELDDDPEYQRRVAAGEIKPIDMSVLEERELPPEAKRSTMIFLAGIAVIMVLGMVEKLRPAFPDETGDLVPLSTGVMIQIVMGVTATAIVLACKVNIKTVVTQSTMTSGLIGLIALFGIAWLADTWISRERGADRRRHGRSGRAVPVGHRGRHLHRRRTDHEPGGRPRGDPADRPPARHPPAVPRGVLRSRASASTSSRPTAPRSPRSRPTRRERRGSRSTRSGTRSRSRCS